MKDSGSTTASGRQVFDKMKCSGYCCKWHIIRKTQILVNTFRFLANFDFQKPERKSNQSDMGESGEYIKKIKQKSKIIIKLLVISPQCW